MVPLIFYLPIFDVSRARLLSPRSPLLALSMNELLRQHCFDTLIGRLFFYIVDEEGGNMTTISPLKSFFKVFIRDIDMNSFG